MGGLEVLISTFFFFFALYHIRCGEKRAEEGKDLWQKQAHTQFMYGL